MLVRTAAVLALLTASTGASSDALRRTMQGSVAGSSVVGMGRSVGSPTAGHLVGGSRLPDSPHLRVVPAYAGGEVRWGLGSLVGMIDRAGARVRRAYPDAVLSVGHLSRHGGGEVDRHASHESGRDADIGFYVRNAQGKSILSDRFVAFRGDGSAPTWPGAFFDDARNWALVKALLTDPQARVTHLFVATPLKARLLAYAAKSGASLELRHRASLAMLQPRGSLPHDDHFHVRIACPGWQRECVEIPLRKKPMLLAKVPVPGKGRARAQAGHVVEKQGEKQGEKQEGRELARILPPASAAPRAAKPDDKHETVLPAHPGAPKTPVLEGAASAVGIPAARLHTPLVKPTEPDADRSSDDAIDDVDGPM